MRIGLVTHTAGRRGGIEWVVANERRLLEGDGHDVHVHEPRDLGARPGVRAIAALSLLFRSRRRLREQDVLVAHYPPSPWIAMASRRPYLYYMHHPLRIVEPTPVRRRRLAFRVLAVAFRPLAMLERRAVRSAAAIATVSPAVAEQIRALYGREASVVPPGVDIDFFTPAGRPADHLLFVGRLDEQYKHLDWALQVAAELGRNLRVVGPGRQRSWPSGVEFIGTLDAAALRAEYREAQLLLFPSEGEDFGMVPLEAMACGLSVVAWDDGHGPSWTLEPFAERCLAPPYDLDRFATLARSLLAEPLPPAALRRHVVEHFSWTSHHDALAQLLRGAAA